MTTNSERFVRGIALRRLWGHALRSLSIRHPDPGVDVEVLVDGEDDARVTIKMWNLRDTSRPGMLQSVRSEWEANFGPRPRGVSFLSFSMYARFDSWPGEDVARLCVLGVWLTYLMHESMELVTEKRRGMMYQHLVVDPHSSFGRGLEINDRIGVMSGTRLGPTPIVDSAAIAVGLGHARREVVDREVRGRLELLTEMEWVRHGGEWQ